MQIPFKARIQHITAAFSVLMILSTAPLVAKTCAEEMPEIEAEADNMQHDANFNVAKHQIEKAKERLEAGKEKSCLRYLESARSAILADQMHNN